MDPQSIPNQRVPDLGRDEEEEDSEDSDEDYFLEDFQPLSAEKDFFVDLHNEFASRSARRRKEALREHEARLEELKDRQNLRQLLFKTNPDSPQLLGPSESNPPTLENTVPQNMSHTASNPLLKAPSPTFQMSKAPKGIGEDGSQKKEKGEGSDTAKTASKGVKK